MLYVDCKFIFIYGLNDWFVCVVYSFVGYIVILFIVLELGCLFLVYIDIIVVGLLMVIVKNSILFGKGLGKDRISLKKLLYDLFLIRLCFFLNRDFCYFLKLIFVKKKKVIKNNKFLFLYKMYVKSL